MGLGWIGIFYCINLGLVDKGLLRIMEIKGIIQSYDINKPTGFHNKGNYVEYVCECGKKLIFIMEDENEKADSVTCDSRGLHHRPVL